ncbi:MAG: hypothetical protein LUF30_03515, partial [Lachnospiraceae bacterium]|nr:hypothetical protein [Lachnospiraceae bacterium]
MKKKQWLYVAIMCIACTLGMGVFAVHGMASSYETESQTLLNGLVTAEDGYLYYYVNGEIKTGWQEINGKTYYFRKSGSSAPKGSAITGLKKIGQDRYYFSSDGVLQTGWVEINGYQYYFRKSAASGHKGAAATGLIKIGDYRYCFTSTGKMCTGWKTINGYRYYFKKAGDGVLRGSAVTGLKKINGNRYYFTSGGKLYTGWKTVNGNRYYFREDGTGSQIGMAETGLTVIGGKQYYFSSSGVLQMNAIVGTQSTGYYYVDDSGVVISEKAICQAVDFVTAHAASGSTAEEKLKLCFTYMRSNYSYTRYYGTPAASDLLAYAESYFTNLTGNCYRYAASVACIAKVLGYEVRVAVGQVASSDGTQMSAHGWAEVNMDETWYICDVNFNVYK